jgi:heme/copper-type cytochrome/quinol oxidase subunit 2
MVVLIVYLICGFVNLVFSWFAMWITAEDRPLGKQDIQGQVVITLTGAIGTIFLIIILCIYTYNKKMGKF